jgi:two-component system, OmpR family, phosphate regulon sensor histidine kinase PhoR
MPRFRRQNFPRRIFYRVAAVQFLIVFACLTGAGLLARSLFNSQNEAQLRALVSESTAPLQRAISQGATENQCPALEVPVPVWAVLRANGEIQCVSGAFPGFSAAIGQISFGDVLAAPEKVHFLRKSGWVLAVVVGPAADRMAVVGNSTAESDRFAAIVDMALLISYLLMVVAAFIFSVYMARRLVFPLGRLILKTKNIHQPDVVTEDDLKEEAFDEWLELESNIDDMRRDLLAKTKRLSREKLELDTIMGAISDAILAVDPDGNPLFYNSRFELLFGRDGLKLENTKLWGIFRDPEILTAFQRSLKEGRVEATRALALSQQDSPKRYFSLSASPLRRQDGSVYGAVGIFHDVTELKAAEQMRIDFVANVSHELRTPLTVIKGYADTLIQDNQQDQGLLDYLNSIARNSDRLMHLMNDLLDLSSIESDSIIQRESLSTEDLSQRIINQLMGAFDRKRQAVRLEVKARNVFADPHRLEQVLVNLLGNANKYTPENGTITVEWYRESTNSVLKVSDTGPGIPIEHHQRLFERFYRVDKARSRDQGGTGLGLAIVKHILQRHEGSVWLESAPGRGTSFFCRFPDESSLTFSQS